MTSICFKYLKIIKDICNTDKTAEQGIEDQEVTICQNFLLEKLMNKGQDECPKRKDEYMSQVKK